MTFLLNVVLILAIGIGWWGIAKIDHPVAKILVFLFFLIPSGPATVSGNASFFGLWMFIIAITLVIKLQPIPRAQNWLLGIAVLYFAPWLYLMVVSETGGTQNIGRFVTYFLFLGAGIVTLYILFEEEVRELLASNKSKDAEIAEQEATIARLEPLSVLGERVAHVTHSFKNNLSQIGTALYYLEELKDPVRAAEKIHQFQNGMSDRIDNILMVSRAGMDQHPEVFDAARVLAGLNQVYLTEPNFLKHAKVDLDAEQATPVEAVRWDFLLMAENILKNALEALTEKGGYGNIQIILKDRVLTLANDGGAMPLCSDCTDSCLDCSRYGRPGRTTKATGSGHGLAQVFATCKKYGWTLRIKTEGEWTRFEIGLTKKPVKQRTEIDTDKLGNGM